MLRSLAAASLISSFLFANSFALGAPLYKIRDLTPDGYVTSVAYDLNASGDAVGVAGGGSLDEAFFFYDHSTGTSTVFGVGTVLPRSAIVGSGFRRAAINDEGKIAGTAMFVGGAAESRGFIYSGGIGGTFTNLGTFFPPGSGIRPASDALDINSAGIATGTASSGAGTIPSETDNIDIYTGTVSPITDIDGDLTTATRHDYGRAINDAGLIAGQNQDGKATLFSGAAETVFLSATSLATPGSVAIDLNEVGQVTGSTSDSVSYIYDTTDSSLRILPSLGTGSRVIAKGINEGGDVVGWADRTPGLSGEARGFVHLYDDDASYLLEDHTIFTGSTVPGLSDWERLHTAWAINDSGWIVGQGDRRFEGEIFPHSRAYLLIPVPEPSTFWLTSLVACVAYRRLRAKQVA
jgi:hypothetical protein